MTDLANLFRYLYIYMRSYLLVTKIFHTLIFHFRSFLRNTFLSRNAIPKTRIQNLRQCDKHYLYQLVRTSVRENVRKPNKNPFVLQITTYSKLVHVSYKTRQY